MIFASDNWAGASEKVIEAVAWAARAGGPAYGGDDLTAAVTRRMSDLFEREVAVFFVATGTAANALALSCFTRPGGIVLCHRGAHVLTAEAGATEFFSGGMRVVGVDGADAKLDVAGINAMLGRYPEGSFHEGQHEGQPVAVSIANLTELGTVYTAAEVVALARLARARGLAVHMDGARFANAVAATGATPAELTWKAGVDVLSLGATKNGCIAADAVVVFDPAHGRDLAYARQRSGHTFSKSWFVAAQYDAWLDGGHWLELASHSNAMAARLAAAIQASPHARLAVRPAGNEIFAVLTRDADARLRAAGAQYYEWPEDDIASEMRPREGEVLVRLIASWRTTPADVEGFAAHLK
jgi:threonine aldolase